MNIIKIHNSIRKDIESYDTISNLHKVLKNTASGYCVFSFVLMDL